MFAFAMEGCLWQNRSGDEEVFSLQEKEKRESLTDTDNLLLEVPLGGAQHFDGDGHHDLALGGAVTGYVAREVVHVVDQLGLVRRRRGAADTPAEGDGLAGHLPHEGAEDK